MSNETEIRERAIGEAVVMLNIQARQLQHDNATNQHPEQLRFLFLQMIKTASEGALATLPKEELN